MKSLTIGCSVVLVLCASGTRLEAQNAATSFEQLQVLVDPGDTVSVLDASGKETTGKIGSLSREVLRLVTQGGERELWERDVTTIRQRRADSLKNGALIGAGVGAAWGVLGFVLVTQLDDGEPTATAAIVNVGFGAAIGTGIGVAIDGLITRRHIIYQRPAGASRVTVGPLLGHGRRGAAVSLKF